MDEFLNFWEHMWHDLLVTNRPKKNPSHVVFEGVEINVFFVIKSG